MSVSAAIAIGLLVLILVAGSGATILVDPSSSLPTLAVESNVFLARLRSINRSLAV
jgi:hypothetical protein